MASVATLYAFVVALGLPYDESAHWSNVHYLLQEHRLPQLGHPHTAYEAQMGPVAYAVDALVAAPLRSMGATEAVQAHGVRLLGLPVLAGLVWVVARLVLLARPGVTRAVALLAALLAVFNPMVVAMTMSVQNDSLALLLGLVALDQGLRATDARAELVTGLLIGLALLTKLTAWPVGPVLAVIAFWRFRAAALPHLARLALPALAVAGWWFARNLDLYGDLTGQRGVAAAGYRFDSYPSHGAHALTHMASQTVTYLWLPVEYVRNTVSTPGPIKAVVVVVTVIVGASLFLLRRLCQPAAAALLLAGALALVVWAVTFLTVQAVAPRVAYLGLGAWALAASVPLQRLAPRIACLVVGGFLMTVHLWFLIAVSPVGWSPGVA